MQTSTTRIVAIYVERSSQRWIVRDREGRYWTLPASGNPWDERQPFTPTDETSLEPVPGHYKYLLGLSA